MIHWGIIGLGNIAKRFEKSLELFDEAKLYGASSLTPSKREAFQKTHPDVVVYEDYQALIDDPMIDIVYIAVRHQDHFKWAKKALEQNKAVLCEKPATLSYNQTEELVELSKKKHTFFMEALKSRFIPMINEIHTIIEQGVIGDIQHIETAFCSDVPYNEKSYLFDPYQGGALYDVGTYSIGMTLDFIKSKVKDIDIECKKEYGVDVYDNILITFESGQTARMQLAIDRSLDKSMKIVGTLGVIEATPFYRPTEVVVHLNNGESFTGSRSYPFDDDFYGQIDAVHQSIAYIHVENKRMSHQDSLDCIALMEAIKEATHD